MAVNRKLTVEEIKENLKKTKLDNHPIVKELQDSFLEYAMSVIVARALPDARDGFKPVHRRVLYAAYALGMTSTKPHKKSARLVGEVIGKYHPHGDTAAYDTMARLAQPFSMRYPLVDGHGNFGSQGGDSPAAMRYTEARLSKIGDTLMNDLEKDTVDMIDNYDGSEIEPVVLPAIFPNLLANGSNGIAVGMATNIPPHNLNELVQAIKMVAANSECTIDEIKQVLQGPDFPTGAQIIGTQGIDDYFRTGRGSVTVRAKYEYKTQDNGKTRITITEIPYMVTTRSLEERITDLVSSGTIEGIADIGGGPTRDGLRFIIETKRGIIPEVLMNQLFKATQLQTNFSVNMLSLVDGVPQILNIKQSIQIYIDHQLNVLTRRTKFELKKAKEREHILEGLHIAVQNIDAVIKTIRESKSNEETIKNLINKFKLTEIQAKAISDMRLGALNGLGIQKIQDELKQLKNTIVDLEGVLKSRERKIRIIEVELDNLVKRFGDERRTEIDFTSSANIDDEDLIPVEDILITMSSRGYLKRLPVDTYRVQRRGGVGVIGLETHEDDDVEKIITASTHTDVLFFTDAGKVYRIRGHQIPAGSRQAKGIPAINLINIEKGEKILSILPVDNYQDVALFFTTLNGISKKTLLSEFERINQSGKIAVSLKEGDKLFKVIKVLPNQEIFIGASNGNMVRFNESQVRCMGRTAAGVHAINLGSKDIVVGLSSSANGSFILSVGAKGVGKLTPVEEYRLTKRNAKGVRTLKVTPKTGKLVCVGAVNGDEDALMITSSGKVIRFSLSTVSRIGRSTQGVKLMHIEENEKLQSVAIFESIGGDETAPEIDVDEVEQIQEMTKKIVLEENKE
ncbi:MAG: DNA topoisomerase (ATP-hydrolyzing) subunit A [Mycoplasmataceae bacterium]|jgi:DNA gyrase subunit A|nr:DNA topoisomerase (ATP-hydrolyzing) subunit A [Mycoplasmataceae bacterium]